MTAATCPICGTEADRRVGNRIAGVWRYCWLCPKCGHRWGWVTEREISAQAGEIARERARELLLKGE